MRKLNETLLQQYPFLHRDLQPLVITVHDWLNLFTDHHYEWSRYDDTLMDVLDHHLSDLPDQTKGWLDKIRTSTNASHRLVYRHYLLKDILVQDIIVNKNHWPLYALMSSTVSDTQCFSDLIPPVLWEQIDHDPYPINILRQRQPLCRRFVHAMSRDYPSDQVADDEHHAILTSFSILYGLYLIYVIVRHECDVAPSTALQSIVDMVLDTSSQLKGVLCHGETYWQ